MNFTALMENDASSWVRQLDGQVSGVLLGCDVDEPGDDLNVLLRLLR